MDCRTFWQQAQKWNDFLWCIYVLINITYAWSGTICFIHDILFQNKNLYNCSDSYMRKITLMFSAIKYHNLSTSIANLLCLKSVSFPTFCSTLTSFSSPWGWHFESVFMLHIQNTPIEHFYNVFSQIRTFVGMLWL